jgi:hypothetical protein
MNFDIVVTSCIYPNTIFINNKLSLNDRISNTRDNLKLICDSLNKISSKVNIYLLESSFTEIDKEVLNRLIPMEFKEKIIFVQFFFTDEEKTLITEKGKGFSELLMLKKYVEFYCVSEYFLKISGRYKILNFSKLLVSSIIEFNSDIVIDYSFLFRKCSSIIFFIKKSSFIEYFLINMNFLDDKSGIYIERYFLSILKSSKIIKSKFKNRPIFPVSLKSGSHNSSYTYFKQLMTNLIYKFP